MATVTEVAATLEALEAEGASDSRLDAELFDVATAEELWGIADEVASMLPILRAVYRRAAKIGASEERARGYLATAHYLMGDFETASALVTPSAQGSSDPVLLDVWALLPAIPSESLARLRVVAERCPDPRILRSLANLALQVGATDDARHALSWLMAHATEIDEVKRLEARIAELS